MASKEKSILWNGMRLVMDDRIPQNNYVLTNDKGDVLAGGDIVEGMQFKTDKCVTHGPATRVRATERVYNILVKEALQEAKVVMNGH